ncbi:MAG: hypothetical protein A2W91_17890 [Bacteroidetes bacterium GWF2_38_335]|nr:MAG: hypothetical protein A2W91_17890 [Bacteroidetes bacterium GWF2_38_335]OFY80155.1 MAG: hypothetical protein A2281_12750 [Bacteroidetes bacterium RIFOXYA12_FULL_38_20]HBS88516.1 hypothetical protein [Bacteroidales bacterium]
MRLVKIVLAFTLFLISISSFSQIKNKNYNEAENAFNLGMYAEAIEYYKKAYVELTENKPAMAEIVYKIGLCFMGTNNPKSAELWFEKAIKVKYPEPLVALYYADMLKMNEKYDEATTWYKNYQTLKPEDPRGEQGVESCKVVVEWKRRPTRYKVENMAFFNSKEADFCATYAKKDYSSIIFSSARPSSSGSATSQVTGMNFTDLFETTADRKGKWTEPIPLNQEVNSPHEEGASSLNMPKATMLFFTRCRVEDKVSLGCQICQASKQGLVWGNVEVLAIASDSVWVGHPSVSEDEMSLYFAANLPGGYGGTDIWMIKRPGKGKPWVLDPINLGPEINTPGTEAFPYIHPDGTLYFSSNYHLGMGGLDIFKAEKNKSDKWNVSNLKYPLNSPADDFGIVFEGDLEKGFITSSRPGGKGMDDIYSFILPPITFVLEGVVVNDRTDEILVGAKVTIIPEGDQPIEHVSGPDGSFKQVLGPNKDYRIEAKMDKFLNGYEKTTTKLIENDTIIKVELRLQPKDVVLALKNIYYTVGKWDLRPESYPELDKLVKTLTDNPEIVIELMSHTDIRPIPITNDTLSQKRAEECVKYLIEKGVEPERMVAKGYAARVPYKMTKEDDFAKYPYLKEGDVLDEKFIKALPTIDQQEGAHQLNRRTEFKIIANDFKSTKPTTPGGTPGSPE